MTGILQMIDLAVTTQIQLCGRLRECTTNHMEEV